MKSLSDVLNRTPWWALVFGGFAVILALAVLVTPFHLIEYRKEGATPEEQKAIKREVDNTFAEGAMDIARSAILTMRGATTDPARREELDRALQELDSARAELRDAGREVRRAKREVQRAKREAVDSAREAAREAASAIEGARKSTEKALQEAGVDNRKVQQALEESLKAAQAAEEEAKKALAEEERGAEDRPSVTIGMGLGKDRPLLDVEVSKQEPNAKRRIEIRAPGDTDRKGGAIVIDLDDEAKAPAAPRPPAAPAVPAPPDAAAVAVPPLPPEVRQQIRHNVSADLKKMGIGAALVLLFIPLFILTVVAKFFIDRSRAAQRMAELKRKEAEYHRMSQQVTEAKLMALQAQVEPHFLYNTLASVQALTEVDPARANTMVGHLIQYLRNALPKMRESISTVGQEVELVRAYLNILQMRMGRRLAFDIAVPESLLATPFPPLMLPSLVENAIKHGLEPQREGGSVLITAQAQDGRLRVTVSDTGRGFGETVGAGVGLANIRERLTALYGETAKLTLEANSPGGVIATIEVPLDGMRAVPPEPPGVAGADGASAQPAQAKTTGAKVIAAVGTAERAWRRTLSFTFSALVIIGAVLTGLLMVGVSTGFIPMQVGTLTGPGGASIGVAGIAVAFAVMVLVLAVVVAILYGLGWLFAGLAIFIPVVILIATLPATAPFILLALLIWWLVRRKKGPEPSPAAAAKIEPVLQAGEPPAPVPQTPPPPPGNGPPSA